MLYFISCSQQDDTLRPTTTNYILVSYTNLPTGPTRYANKGLRQYYTTYLLHCCKH